MNEKPLAERFTKHRFEHVQVKREGDAAIFERKAAHHRDPHWEVIVIQHFKAQEFPDGRRVPAREGYPGSEQWGTYGWTYTTLPDAERRFNDLLERAALP